VESKSIFTRTLFISLLAILFAGTTVAADSKPATEKEKFSYTIGFQIGQGFKRDGTTTFTG